MKELLQLSKDHNPNYVAKIVEVRNVGPHPNADRLKLANVDGYTIVVGSDVKNGDVGVYFPIECIICPEFLSYCNLFRDRQLNRDPSANPGFFDIKYKQQGFDESTKISLGGRVRAVKLRGIVSEGFWIELDKFRDYCGEWYDEDPIGLQFDTINGNWFVKKYIPATIKGENSSSHKEGRKAKISLIIPDQFRFHIDTEQLQRNLFKLNPRDLIQITYKLHGTSFIASNLMCKNPNLSLYQRIGKFLGFNIVDTQYSNIHASRRVIKNGWLSPPNSKHYYKEDIWGAAALTVQPYLNKGLTLYGEVVGYVNESSMIQNGYHYGCKPGEFDTYIYRITYTNVDGKVFEFSAKQVQSFCKERDLKPVPELYYGYVTGLFPHIDYSDRNWSDKFIENLKSEFVEGYTCGMCNDEVPAEGIVLRIENGSHIESYKLKNSVFLLRESKELDQGHITIEEETS